MSYHIELTDEAKLNIAEASEYYLEISQSLQNKFQADLIKTIDMLKENPQHHQIRYRGIRIAHLKKFPFSIHFLIQKNIIYVLKILHQKRYYN